MGLVQRSCSFAIFCAWLTGSAVAPPAFAQSPDFSNVSDVMAGRRLMFPVDDVVVTWPTNSTSMRQVLLTSHESRFSSYPPRSISTSSVVSAIGRMFDMPHDLAVGIADGNLSITMLTASSPSTQQFPLPSAIGGSTPASYQFPAGDFTGDGFTDFAFIAGGNVYVVTAQDTTNPAAGVFFSSPGAPPFPLTGPSILAAGDFDGDGTDEVALIASPFRSSSVSVTIYEVAVTGSPGALQSIALTPSHTLSFSAPAAIDSLAATAGNFGGVGNSTTTNQDTGIVESQLLLVYKYSQNGDKVMATVIANNEQSQLQSFSTVEVRSGGSVTLNGVDSGYMLFPGSSEQAVVAYQGTDEGHLAVLVVDENLHVTVASQTQLPGPDQRLIQGIALGNFGWPLQGLTLQVAVFTCDGGPISAEKPSLHIYHITDTTTFALGGYEGSTISGAGDCQPPFSEPRPGGIAVGDLQGRSVRLGAPQLKFTVQHTQPRLVLGMPPMHVDWVTPVDGTAPEVLNLTAVLGGFYSSYQTTQSNQAQSSTQGTTSYTNSVSETATAGYQWGDAETGSVSVSVTESAGLMHSQSVSQSHGSFSSTAFDVSAGTGFDDLVWFNAERHSVWAYPVIGQTACPEGLPDCSVDEQKQVTVLFAGPDQIVQESMAGATLEWFQPVTEPGNVFSYPGNLAQLSAQVPNIDLLTASDPTEFATDSSTLTEQARWTSQSSTGSTVGSATNVWWGVSVSVSQKPGVEGGASASATIAYNGSTSISHLYSSTTTLGESTGIGIAKPGTFPDPGNYQYGIMPFIFGNSPNAQAPQTFDLGTDISTTGILQAAFVADPTMPGAGSWWQGTYTKPDLAFNHPARWDVQSVTTSSAGANCVRVNTTSTTTSCATFNAPEADIWNSEFYWMKGLLITPASANGEGPQLAQATAGDSIQIQARVYNYSLASAPANSRAVVQFYGQPWNTGDNTPLGNAFLIDQVVLDTPAAFSGTSTTPNFSLATTTRLDTASYPDQQLVFWVAGWLEDAQGNMIVEMPGHGLTSKPGTLSTIADAAHYVEPYSNNVGLYHSTFYIAPPANAALAGPGAAKSKPAAKPKAAIDDIRVTQFSVAPSTAMLNQKVSVSATLHVADTAVDGVVVRLYDGDPAHGGQLFDYESIAHLRANEDHQVRVPFRPRSCGMHTLVLRTNSPQVTAATTLDVVADPLPFVQDLIAETGRLTMRGSDRLHLTGLLRDAERMLTTSRDLQFALVLLAHYRGEVASMRTNMIPAAQADSLLAKADLASSCMGVAVPGLAIR